MSQSYILKGGLLPNGTKSDIAIKDGLISAIGTSLDESGSEIFDISDCVVLPGLVDLHTHLREPGREDSEIHLQLQIQPELLSKYFV